MLVGGIAGFVYCTSQMSALTPMAADAGLADYLRNEAGRYELGRYLAAASAAVGALLAMFPKGR
jgi:hypothetical protein